MKQLVKTNKEWLVLIFREKEELFRPCHVCCFVGSKGCEKLYKSRKQIKNKKCGFEYYFKKNNFGKGRF